MHLESRITWDKLCIELELLNTEDPASLIQLLIGLNCLIVPGESPEWCLRTINFMTYELMAKSEGLSEPERIALLNDYFFRIKGFQILNSKVGEVSGEHLLMKPVLTNRAGSPLAIALVYLHLASHLDLPAYLIRLKGPLLLKWVRSGRSTYIDLAHGGSELTEDKLVEMVHRATEGGLGAVAISSNPDDEGDPLGILPHRKIFLRYVEDLSRILERSGDRQALHLAYNTLLKVEPLNSRILGRRAMLRYQLGLNKEAIADFKRFFSFVDHHKAPVDILVAYNELNGSFESQKPPGMDFLH